MSRAKIYDEQFAKTFPYDWEMQILNKYLIVPGILLDTGCGTGRHLIPFANRGFHVVGVDKDEEFIEAAKNKLKQKKLNGNVDLIIADICSCCLKFSTGRWNTGRSTYKNF